MEHIASTEWCEKPCKQDKHQEEGEIPRSTFSKGLPLAKTIFSPACLKASAAVHSAVKEYAKRTDKWNSVAMRKM